MRASYLWAMLGSAVVASAVTLLVSGLQEKSAPPSEFAETADHGQLVDAMERLVAELRGMREGGPALKAAARAEQSAHTPSTGNVKSEQATAPNTTTPPPIAMPPDERLVASVFEANRRLLLESQKLSLLTAFLMAGPTPPRERRGLFAAWQRAHQSITQATSLKDLQRVLTKYAPLLRREGLSQYVTEDDE